MEVAFIASKCANVGYAITESEPFSHFAGSMIMTNQMQ
jgi:hypothetical protein